MFKTEIKSSRRIFSIALVMMLVCALSVPAGIAYADEVGVLPEDSHTFTIDGQTVGLSCILSHQTPRIATVVTSTETSVEGVTSPSSWMVDVELTDDWIHYDPAEGSGNEASSVFTISIDPDNPPAEVVFGSLVLRQSGTGGLTLTVNVGFINTYTASPFGTYDHAKGGTLAATIAGDFNKFLAFHVMDSNGVPVIDPLVDGRDYTKIEGSTIITLTEQYLKALPVGQYNFQAVYTDGTSALIPLTVVDTRSTNPVTPTTPSSALPRTGDTVSELLGLSLFIAFAAASGVFMLRRRMMKTNL